MRTWTDDETVTLISQWPTASAAQIASTLHRSRASVMRKAHRLCAVGVLPPRVEKHYTVKPVWGRQAHRGQNFRRMMPAKPPPPPPPIDTTLNSQPCALFKLDRTRCHWPLGDGHHVAQMFCGGVAVQGFPYCGYHLQLSRR